MNKAMYTQEPQQFHRDPDGSTVFRWDIEQVTTEDGDMWQCNECRIYTTPIQANIEQGAIQAYSALIDQATLLHDNNKSVAATGEQSAEYLGLLSEISHIRSVVQNYFDSLKPLDPVLEESKIKSINADKAKVAQGIVVNKFKLNEAKRALGLTVEEAPAEDLATYVATLEADILNPSSDSAYHPPLPPGVTPPAVAAIIATITREPGWNNVLGWRIVLDISDPAYIPANIAISVYSSANCVGYLYTPGALQLNSTTGKYFAVCPPGQEKGDVAYHFGLLYGAAQLSCWTVAAGEQTKTIQIFGD